MVRYLRNGSSGLRLLVERSKSLPVSAGDQRFCEAPQSLQPAAPCTCSMHTTLVLSAALPASVAAQSRPAGTMASSRGRPIAAPAPLSIARRERCLPLRYCICQTSLGQGLGRVVPSGAWSSATVPALAMRKGGLLTTPRMNDDML